MKRSLAVIVCSMLFLSGLTPLKGATVVLQEDFESSVYVIGNDPTTAAIPLLIDKRTQSANRLTEGVYGTDATLKIVAPALAAFGNKSLEAEDFSFAHMFDFTISSAALRDAHDGNGVQKGRVQFDFLPTMVAEGGTSAYWYFELNLYDDCDVATSPLQDDQLVNIKNNNATVRYRLSNSSGLMVQWDSPTQLVSGSAYRIVADFDVATRAITIDCLGPLPAETSIHPVTEYIFSRPTAASPFKGVRGLHVNLSENDKQKIQIDNIVVTDNAPPPVASAQNWAQY